MGLADTTTVQLHPPAGSSPHYESVREIPDAARRVLAALASVRMPAGEAAVYLRGVAAGYETPPWSWVLVDLVDEASYELVFMTYSAAPYEPLQGAGSALNGPEPAHAFNGVEGVQVWHWPVDERTEPGARVTRNIEAGLLVRGGTPEPITRAVIERPHNDRGNSHACSARPPRVLRLSADAHRGIVKCRDAGQLRALRRLCLNSDNLA
ncbi:hypothetical protein ACQP2K_24935 [Microbispora siamensis]